MCTQTRCLIAIATLKVCSVGPAPGQPPPPVASDIPAEHIRSIFGGAWVEDLAVRELHRSGARAFHAYDTILADPKSKPEVVAGVLEMLNSLELDRGQFLKYARQRVKDPDPRVRFCAMKLLGRIGTSRDAPVIIAFMFDDLKGVVHGAAWGLENIGEERDLPVFDIWLVTNRNRNDVDLRQYVTKCRDDLKRRLEKKVEQKK